MLINLFVTFCTFKPSITADLIQACPGVVSCANVRALVARDAIYLEVINNKKLSSFNYFIRWKGSGNSYL